MATPAADAPADLLVTLPDEDLLGLLEGLGPLPAGVRTRVWGVDSDPRAALGEDADAVRVVVLPNSGGASAMGSLGGLPRLELVQALSAGYENLLDRVPGGVALANAVGVHDTATSELAVTLLLAVLRGVPEAVRDAEQAAWRPRRHPGLADARVLVLGAGGIGGAVTDRLRAFEADVVRVASRARTDARGEVHGTDELPALLPEVDAVVVALPLTEATRGIVDAAFLAAMPGQSVLVNVGRGALVDTGALLAELRKERLHAALDVVEPEPLPADHPLWGAPNLLLTPHVGGATRAFAPRAARMLHAQLTGMGQGRPPQHVVARALPTAP